MKPKLPNLESILILLISCELIVISPPSVLLKLLNFAYRSQLWEKRVSILSHVLVFYGISLLGLAVLSYLFSLNDTTLKSQVIRLSQDVLSILREETIPSIRHCFASNHETIFILLVLVIGVSIRGYFLSQPFRFDESVTFLKFVNKGFYNLFLYPDPNNHVLNTLLVKVSTFIWGAHPASIRFPAFLAGIGLIPLVFCLCRTLNLSGIFASISVSVFPFLVLFSTNARGYTLLVFLTLALTIVGASTTKKPSLAGATLVSSIAALGMMTMPSMLFPIVGIYCWLACLLLINGNTLKTILFEFVFPCSLMTIAFTIVLYTPVILASNGVESIVANRFVQSQPWQVFLSEVNLHFQDTYRSFFASIPKVGLFICAILTALGIYGSARKKDWSTLLILPSILLGSAIVFFLKHKISFPRMWIFVIPFILLTADSGFTYIIENISRKIRSYVRVVILVIGAFFALSLISTDSITGYGATGVFPEASIVAKYLKPIMTSNDVVHAQLSARWPLDFYLWYYNVPEHDEKDNPETRKIYFVIQKSEYSIEDMTDNPTIVLLDFGDMVLYQAVDIEDQ